MYYFGWEAALTQHLLFPPDYSNFCHVSLLHQLNAEVGPVIPVGENFRFTGASMTQLMSRRALLGLIPVDESAYATY